MGAIVVFLVVLVGVGVVSEHLVDGPVTPPAVLTAAGLVTALVLGTPELDRSLVLEGTELTLSLVLFTDASRISPASLRHDARIPARLLLVALPLSIALLTGVVALFPDVSIAGALLVGASLAATDAALARVIIESESLPRRLRQAINVESGLNDGLATPIVTIAIALVAGGMATAGVLDGFLVPIGSAVLVGAIVGAVGGGVLQWARARDLVDPTFAQVATIAVIALVVVLSKGTGAITFVGAFVAGLAFRRAGGDHADEVLAFTEDAARLLTMAAFFVFGLDLLPIGLAAFQPVDLLVVVVALTVARMLPVAVSLVGTGVALPTVGMVGWFGPRGLASVLFLLLAVEELGDRLPARATSLLVVTVVASLVLHGATSAPFSRRYAAWLARTTEADGDPLAGDDEAIPIGRTRA